jgi:hypothetical protein
MDPVNSKKSQVDLRYYAMSKSRYQTCGRLTILILVAADRPGDASHLTVLSSQELFRNAGVAIVSLHAICSHDTRGDLEKGLIHLPWSPNPSHGVIPPALPASSWTRQNVSKRGGQGRKGLKLSFLRRTR